MKARTLALCGVALGILSVTPVDAQQVTRLCVQGTTGNCVPVDSGAPLPVTGGSTSGTYVSTAALAANLVVKNAPAKLVDFNVSADRTLSAAAWWVMIYDATSAPGDGAVTPAKCYAAPSGTTSMSGAFTAPSAFLTGVTIGVSTTGCFSKTASTHAFISGDYE